MSVLDSAWLMASSGPVPAVAAGGGEADSTALAASNSSNSASSGSGSAPTHAAFTPSPTALPKHTSPLLSSTPPAVTKALSHAYPLILATDAVFGLLTWTSDDAWKSFLLVLVWVTFVLYYEVLVVYFGHLLVVAAIAGYVFWTKAVEKRQKESPTLDAIVHTLSNATSRINLFLTPITSLSLTTQDVTRLLFTTLFLSPVFMVLAFFILSPRMIILISGLVVLTYHSVYARVTRAILWRSRSVRLLTFYLTGLDFSGARMRAHPDGRLSTSVLGVQSTDGKPVKFTYVLFENQRRWLGIGWTANLLAYERAPWTDEFLNESVAPDVFKLPEDENLGVEWEWVDKAWRLDLTNDGGLVLTSKKSKSTTADPGSNDGWIYFDNTWKKPTTVDAFSKYTRRRRWVRTAQLVSMGYEEEKADIIASTNPNTGNVKSNSGESKPNQTTRTDQVPVKMVGSKEDEDEETTGVPTQQVKQRRKSLRFED